MIYLCANKDLEEMQMNIKKIEEELYASVKKSLMDFAKTDNNKAVYAVVLDCCSDNGQICIRYGNKQHFQENLKDFERYAYLYQPYGKYGLHGMKYSVGDFGFIDFEESEEVKHFLDSYYYYRVGDYWGEEKPVEVLEVNGHKLKGDDLKEHIKEIWENLILDCIKQLQKNDIGLDITEDFIIFMCDHDISNEEFEQYVKKTVDAALFDKLLAESNLK